MGYLECRMSSISAGNWRKPCALAMLAFLLIIFPAVIPDPSYLGMLVTCGIASILAMSWIMILRVGHLSLGQVAFLAIGAYSSAIAATKFGLSPWLGLILGGFITAGFALAIGYVVLRIRGLYFAIMTFAFAEVIRLGISNSKFMGGVEGISGIPELNLIDLPGLAIIKFDSTVACYYVMLFLVGGTALALWRIDHSGLGRTCRAIAMNEDLSQSLGIPVFRYKLMSFVVACFFAGVGGAFSAHYYRCLDPTSFTVTASIIVQIQATVGGAGAIVAGGILGATLITIVDHFLISIDPRLIIFFMGAIILAVTFFLPEGVVSLPRILKNYGLKVGSWFHS